MTDADVGQFLNQWNKIEAMIHGHQKRKHGEYSSNLYSSLKMISEKEPHLKPLLNSLNKWRLLRNEIVHNYGKNGINVSKLKMDDLNVLIPKLEKALR